MPTRRRSCDEPQPDDEVVEPLEPELLDVLSEPPLAKPIITTITKTDHDIFGLMFGAMGLFVFPAVGLLLVLGPLSGMIAGAIGGAGVGALVSALIAAGVPNDQALKYQSRLQAGQFLVVVHGGETEAARARELLRNTTPMDLHSFGKLTPLLMSPEEGI